jgi:hypothetical protein
LSAAAELAAEVEAAAVELVAFTKYPIMQLQRKHIRSPSVQVELVQLQQAAMVAALYLVQSLSTVAVVVVYGQLMVLRKLVHPQVEQAPITLERIP